MCLCFTYSFNARWWQQPEANLKLLTHLAKRQEAAHD